jgi:hypothetical protein
MNVENKRMIKCRLCEQAIENYNPAFNRLKINESCSVDICQDCIDKFIKWQGSIIVKLFPTKALKKRYEK